MATGHDLSTPPETRLRFERTVPCAIAHRRAVGEVFVTDSTQVGEHEYALAIQVPRAHSLWFDRPPGQHDTLSAMEAARQGTFVVVHRYLGIAIDLPFSLHRVRFQVTDTDLFVDDERSPFEGVVHYRLVREKQTGADLGSLSFTGMLTVGGSPAMDLSGDIVFMPGADYETLRAYQRARKPIPSGGPPPLPSRLDPALVGRMDARNVVIGPPADRPEPPDEVDRATAVDRAAGTGGGDGLRFRLVPDRRHPAFFDHDYDHVPGPFIVEGFRQAALVAAVRAGALDAPAAAVTGCAVAFTDFGEFEAEIECSARVNGASEDGRVSVAVGLLQFGERLAEGEIELSPHA